MGVLTRNDRAFLDRNFARYGAAWQDGIAGLERNFEVAIAVRETGYVLSLTLRIPPHARFELEVQNKTGGMTQRAAEPDGTELSAAERERFDAIVRGEAELWLVERTNSSLVRIPVPCGLADVGSPARCDATGSRNRAAFDGLVLTTTRRDGDFGIAYYEAGPDRACVVADLEHGVLAEPVWLELPMLGRARWLARDERAWIDGVLRAHGDLGTGGNVTDGLAALLDRCEIRLLTTPAEYTVLATPRDGFGHRLRFTIDRSAGTIHSVAAGHFFRPERDRPR